MINKLDELLKQGKITKLLYVMTIDYLNSKNDKKIAKMTINAIKSGYYN